jgi:hypothetical protein
MKGKTVKKIAFATCAATCSVLAYQAYNISQVKNIYIYL